MRDKWICFALALWLIPRMALAFTNPAMINRATNLFGEGRTLQSWRIVERLLHINRPPMQVLFLAGLIQERFDNYNTSATYFRRMLSRNPSLLRPRLELAKVLYLKHDYVGSRYNFNQVLSAQIPENVRKNIYVFLNGMGSDSLKFNYSLTFLSDSNPTQATNANTVSVRGLTFTLNKNAKAHREQGLLFQSVAIVPIPKTNNLFLSAAGEIYDYPGHYYDQAYYNVLLSKKIRLGQSALRLSLGGQYASYQDYYLYNGVVSVVSYRLRPSPDLEINPFVSIKSYYYKDYKYLNGWSREIGLASRWAINLDTYAALRTTFTAMKSVVPSYGYSLPSITLFLGKEFSNGWISRFSLGFSTSRYNASDPFFEKLREDHEWQTDLSIGNREITFMGMMPLLRLGYTRNISTIALYQYTRYYYGLALTKKF